MSEEKRIVMLLTVVLMGLLLQSNKADATVWNVGEKGWSFSVSGWDIGKNFKAGDILVFNYRVGDHSVAIVNKSDYENCVVPPNAAIYSSGHDQFVLSKGTHYFVCGIPGHCIAGMKIAPNAA